MIDRIGDPPSTRRPVERASPLSDRKPMTQLLQETATQIQGVVRGEVRVAIAKARDEVTAVARASVLRVAAALFGVIGVVLMMMSAIAFLETHMSRWLAVLVVALTNLALAYVLATRPMADRSGQ